MARVKVPGTDASVSDAVATACRHSVPLANLPAAGSLSEVGLAGTQSIASNFSEIALPWPLDVARALCSGITKALLSLCRGGARIEISARTVELVRDIPVGVRDSTAMGRIVYPVVAVGHIHAI